MYKLDERRKNCPEFMNVVDLICEQNFLQAKKIHPFILDQDAEYWAFAEDLCLLMSKSLLDSEKQLFAAAQAYNDLCMNMLRDQIKFRKTGIYPANNAEVVRNTVYDQPETMYAYMLGLLISMMLWPNHYKLFRYFRNSLIGKKPASYFEVGAGHGVFVLEALRLFPRLSIEVCDISPTSIEMSKNILKSFGVDLAKIKYVCDDFFHFPLAKNKYDFIAAGEILEHTTKPIQFLQTVKQLLTKKGVIYLSTCANAPAIDHVYHFRSISEIRAVIDQAGLMVKDEIVLPAENLPVETCEKELLTINYGALLGNRQN